MTRIARTAVVAAALPLLATAALAEGFSVYDLGEMPTRELCMQKAGKILGRYLKANGGAGIDPTDWIVYGWDFGPGDNDLTLMCPIFRGDVVNAMLVVHGEGEGEAADANRIFVADEVNRLWLATP